MMMPLLLSSLSTDCAEALPPCLLLRGVGDWTVLSSRWKDDNIKSMIMKGKFLSAVVIELLMMKIDEYI